MAKIPLVNRPESLLVTDALASSIGDQGTNNPLVSAIRVTKGTSGISSSKVAE